MDILKFVEALPDSVKNIVISALLNSSMAMKNVEQDARHIEALPSYQQGQPQQQQRFRRQSPQQLLESMRKGEYNEQYVDYYYEILKRADDLVLNSTPEQMRLLAERYGMGSHATARYNHIAKKEQVTYNGRDRQQVYRDEINRRTTSDDNFPVERMVSNRKSLKNVLDHAMGGKPVYDYAIKVQRMFQTQYNIERITEYLHVKVLQSEYNGRLLEIYIPKNQGVRHLQQSNPAIFEEFKNISGVSFADDYGNVTYYRVHGLYRISDQGMYDVVKFKANKIENIGVL
jgi:hypothetical protein